MKKLVLMLMFGVVGCSGGMNGNDRTGGGGNSDPGTGGDSGSSATGGRAATGGSGGKGTGGSDTGGSGGMGSGTGGSGTGGAGTGGSGTGGSSTGGTGGQASTGGSSGTGGAGGTMAGTGGSSPPPTRAFAYASGAEFGGSTLTVFALDLTTGALTKKGMAAGGTSPTYLAVHPSGKFLFVNNEQGNGVTSFSIGADGALTMINKSAVGGNPAHVGVHKSGKWLFSAGYNGGTMTITKVGEDGSLSAGSTVKPGAMAHFTTDDGVTGNFIFVPCLGANHVAMYKFDATTGQATPNSPATISVGGGPRHMAFNPNGKWAYVSQENGSAITTLAYDSTTGLLSAPKNTPAPSDGVHVVVHPNGKLLFHIARSGTTTVYKIGEDGGLTAGAKTAGGNDGALTRDGKYLLVVSGATVKAYAVDENTGDLKAAGTGQAANTAQSVTTVEL